VFINVHLQTNNQVSKWTTIDDTGCIPDRVGDVPLSRQADNATSERKVGPTHLVLAQDQLDVDDQGFLTILFLFLSRHDSRT
jgi:hypothetical protein